MVVDNPLIRLYLLQGWHCGGKLKFPWHEEDHRDGILLVMNTSNLKDLANIAVFDCVFTYGISWLVTSHIGVGRSHFLEPIYLYKRNTHIYIYIYNISKNNIYNFQKIPAFLGVLCKFKTSWLLKRFTFKKLPGFHHFSRGKTLTLL